MKDTLRKLKGRRYAASILIVMLLVFVVGLISLLKPIIKNINIKNVLSKTTSLNASVIDGVSEDVSSNNYDEIKYQIKVNKEDNNDEAVIIGTLTDKENKYARFKEMKDAVIEDNGKKITLTTKRKKVTITVIISNAPYGTSINPKFKINSEDESKSKINVDPVTITGKSVEGTVVDEKGTFYSGLELSLNNSDGEVKRTYTRDNGEYVFSLGDVDTYEVKLAETKYQIVRYTEETTDENKRILNIVVKEVEPFNLNIKKTISKLDLVVNGKKQTFNYDDEQTVVRSMKNAKTIEGSIYYNISIKNTGEIKGTLTALRDVIPNGLSFDESKNPGWTKDGKYLFYTPLEGKEIGPFEKENATLVLDIVKTSEAKNYINTAIATGDDYKYVVYYLNNKVFREEYVISSETIEDINPGVENFDGWYTDKAYTNKYNFKNAVLKDTILFGKINDNKYSVTFMDINPNDGVETILDIVEVKEGTPVDLIDTPEYPGYTFKCFTLNDSCYDDEEITEDVTLYTKYTTDVYDINYNLNGGEVSEDNPETYTVKDEITLHNPSKEGYTFIGWLGTGLDEETIDVTIPKGSTGNRTYIAYYEINRSSLTVDPNGGTYLDNASSVTITEDYGTIRQIANSVRRGYDFKRYNHTGGGIYSNGTYTFNNDDGTLTAEYEIIPYEIHYAGLTTEEETTLDNPTGYNVETETFTLREPETRKDEHQHNYQDFLGWDDGSGNVSKNISIEKGSIGDRTYTAIWKENEDDYSITYYLNGGAPSEPNPDTYTRQTTTFTLHNPSKTGYTFAGWSGTGITGMSSNVTIPKGSAGDREYTANYQVIPYEIRYNGLTPEEEAALHNPTGYNIETENITITNPSRTGYTFLGWSGTGIQDKSTSVIVLKGSTGDREYTAHFEKQEYSLTYTLNGGVASPENPTKYSVESADITLNNPTRTGYTFVGWTGTDVLTPTMIVTIPHGSTGHRSFLANYNPITYNIDYDYDGGSVSEANPATYNIETPDITFNTPEKEGYIFKNYTIGGQIVTGIPQGTTGNKSVKANYEIRKYHVNYYNESTLYSSDEVDWNTTTTAPTTNPTKAHHIFLYWSEDGTNPYDFSTHITDDKNLFAVYEEVVAPTITIEPSLDLETNKTWVCGDSNDNNCGVTVTIESEHADYELYYKVGNGEATLYTAPFGVYENVEITAWSKKSNINSESINDSVVNVDTTAPTINNPGTGASSFNMTVSGTAQDAESGVKKFTLYAKEKDALVWDENLTYESEIFDGIKDHAENYDHTFYGVQDDTEYIVKIVSEDYVGNTSEREVEVKTHPYVARVVGKNGILWYTVDPDTKEFIIDEGKEFLLFDSIQSAVDYCANVQCTIQTNPVFEVVNEQVTVAEGQNVTIDLDGRGITSNENVTFINNGKLQITDRNPRLNGEEHESIGFVSNPAGKAIVNNNILIIGDGSSEASETFIVPELDRPIIDGKVTAIEQNKELHFYDGRIESDTLAITNNGDDVITQYSYNVIITTDEVTGQNVASMARVKDPEARIRSTYYAKLNINSAEDAVTSSRKGTVTTEQAKLLSKIKQAGDYGFTYDSVNDKIYSGNESTANTTSLSYLKLDLTNETENRFITFDTFIDTINSNSYGYISVSETFGQTGTQIYKTTGNDITGTRLYELKKGKVYYIYFGFVKGGGDINKYENFEIYNFRLLGSKQETTDLKIYSDNTNYQFVKQNDGSYESTNNGIGWSNSHSYMMFDLRNQTNNIDLIINTTVSSQADCDIGYIYLSDNEAFQAYDVTDGRYLYTSGEANRTTVIPLETGKMNYVHFGYFKNGGWNIGEDKFTINSIAFSSSKTESIVLSSDLYHNNTDIYYFDKLDHDPNNINDLSGNNHNGVVHGAIQNQTKDGFVFEGNDYIIVNNGFVSEYVSTETAELEYSTTNTSRQTLYIDSNKLNIAVGLFDSYIVVSNRTNLNFTFDKPNNYADGNKHKITITYDGTNYGAYFDGEPLTQRRERDYISSNDNAYIGTTGFIGTIYNLKVYNRVLTEEEITGTADNEGLLYYFDGANSAIPSEVYISNNNFTENTVAHSYLTYDLTNVNEDKYLYLNATVSSRASFGTGYIQVTNSADLPTETSNTRVFQATGELYNQIVVIKIPKNKISYIHFVYNKQGRFDNGVDQFTIKDVRLFNTIADAYSVNPNNYSKVNTMYFEKANLNTEVDTIELLKDITLDYSIVIPQEKEVVLDLNGFTITSNINDHIIKNNGKLTIKDSSYDDRVKHNVDYKLEQERLFEEASEQYLADLAEYEEYAGLCEDCEPSNEYIYDTLANPTGFSTTDSDQVYKALKSTDYILEVWGGQGGGSLKNGTPDAGEGYGGYSIGTVSLNENDILYINVGGKGTDAIDHADAPGGYNGGGLGTWDHGDNEAAGGGGGATHIALESGLLSTFEDKQDKLLIVAGGGGGRSWGTGGGSGGGFTGGAAGGDRVANQLEGYAFGQGQNATGVGDSDGHGGGGGGYYGGYESNRSNEYADYGGGGSGYIGNELLTNKSMYCYNCLESGEPETKTISVNTYSEEPTSNTPKKGDGYARITAIISEEDLETLYENIDKQYNVKTRPKFIDYLDGIDFDGTININQLTPESTPTYNSIVEEYASGAITSTIANAILNEEYATLILERGTININKDSKIAIENRGNLAIRHAEINANNASTIGVFNETNANITFVDGVINAKGSSSVGIVNRSNQPSISNAKVVTTPTNAIGIKNESLENVTYSNLDISGAGIGFRELSVGNTYITDSTIKSTGNSSLYNVSGATPGELIVSSSTLSGNIILGGSAERVTINNSTFGNIYNSYGYLTINDSNFNYLENQGKTNITGSTITGSDTLIYSYGGESNGTWSSYLYDSKVLLKNSTLNSTATYTGVNVIKNYDSMTIDNVTINNTNGTKSTAIYNIANTFPENSDVYPYGTGAYLNIPGTINIDPTFGTAINNTGIVILGSYAKNAETQYEYGYSGHQEEFVAPATGTYKLETWGAVASNTRDSRRWRGWTHFIGGYGAYASGNIELTEGDKLYIHVGGAGTLGYLGYDVDNIRGYYGSYNGGGASIPVSGDYWHGAGGGATDISLSNEDDQIYYDNGAVSYKRSVSSYEQRILVAGGGSACGWQTTCYGGYNVDPSESNLGYGARSGGGGYYGGSYGFGGSSYASNTLSNVILKNGREEMPDYNTSSGYMRGNNSSGYARITLLDTTTDDTVKTTPNITATNYGITGSGTIRFLDGTINAKVAVSSDIELVTENYDIYNSKDSNNNENMILVANADSRPVPEGQEEFVAAIGNAKYTTIQNAIDASNNGDEIDILVNIEQQNMINISPNKVITIDYNGHTVKSYNPDYLYNNLGTLTIKDSTNTLGMNTFIGDKYIYNEGTLSLNNIYIDNNEYYAINLIENNDGIITMNGVKLEMGDGKTTEKVGIKNSKNGIITIHNSTINLNYNNKMFDNYGTLTIQDSIFNTYTPTYNHTMYQVYNNEGATVTLDGNTHVVTGDSRASKYLLYNEGTATIENMDSHIELVGNASILTLETNNFTSGTLNNTGLLYINSGTYSNTFNINDGGKTIDNTENLYSLIMRGGTINTTLNINTTNISNIEGGKISVTSEYAINNTAAGTINLGVHDGVVETKITTRPSISGKSYGIYTSNPSLVVNFYDGIISGTQSYNVTIGEVESGYSIHREFDSDNNIETKYLTQEAMFINDTHDAEYNTISELNTALSNGSIVDDDVIKVYRDITITNNDNPITIPSGLKITFDINGKTVDKNNESMFIINGELDAIDGTINSTGKIDSTKGNMFVNNGTLNVISGNYVSEQYTTETEIIKNNVDGTLNISGGIFTKYYDYLGYVQIVKGSIVNNSGTANVTGGEFYTNASHSSRTMYIFSSVVFDNKETGTLTVTGGDYDGIIGYTRNYDGVLTGNYKTWFNQDSQARGTLIYNYGTASIEDITSNQANIGYNSGTLTLDNVTMNNIYQMTENGWNSESGGFYNFVNTGTTNIIDSNFEIRHSFVDNKGGTLNIENTTIDKLSNGINYRYLDDNPGLCKSSHIVYNYATGEVNITDSNLYNRGSGEVIQNKGLTNVTDSTLEAASNNVIINTAATTNVKGDSSIVSNSGNYSGITLSNSSTLNLGEPIEIDGTVSQTKPFVKGVTYGVSNSGSTFNFYDGLIEGQTLANSGTFNTFESGYTVIYDTDGDYKSNYLDRIPIVQNITQATSLDEHKYYDLKTAFADANDGDTLSMIADYSSLPTDETAVNNRNVTFDINGKILRQSNNILIQNNGTLNITDNSQNGDGNVMLLSGTNIINNDGIINFIGGKLSSNLAGSTIIKNTDPNSVLTIKDNAILDSSTAAKLIDNSGTTNIYNGAYLHNVSANAILNKNILNIVDLNNDNDNSTSSNLNAPWIYLQDSYNSYRNPNPYAIYTYANSTTNIYGGIFGSTSDLNTACESLILSNSGTTNVYNLNTNVHHFTDNSGILNVKDSYFHYSEYRLIINSGTLAIEDTTFEISDSSYAEKMRLSGTTTLDNITVIGKNSSTTYAGSMAIVLGTLNIRNSNITARFSDCFLRNESNTLIENSTIVTTTGIYNRATLNIDASSITTDNYIVENQYGTTNIRNNSTLTSLNSYGLNIYNTSVLNINDDNTIIANNGAGIILNHTAKLTLGTMGGTPSTEHPYIEGSTFGVRSETYTTTFNFYDGLIVGQTGPNAVFGGVSNVESEYETESVQVTDPDTQITKYYEYLVHSASYVAVAKVGNYTFTAAGTISPSNALQNAINFAIGDGTNVNDVDLLTSVDLVNDQESITASMPVTINLYGNTINQASPYLLDSNITLNNNSNLGTSVSKLLGDVFDISSKPKDILIYELSDGTKLDSTKTYKLYRDGKLVGLEREELGRYRYKGNDEKLTPIKGRLYIDNLQKGSYKLESSDNKSIEFSIDSEGNISGNVAENTRTSDSASAIANSEAELILQIQTGKDKHYYWLLIIPIIIIISLLIILKRKKREI